MDNIEKTTETLKRIEFGLFPRGQGAGPRFFGKLVHAGMIAFGKLDFK
jgi:hypothetical protein